MVCRTTKLLTEHSPCQMCFLRQQRQQDYCFQLVNCALFLEDNRDNRNNKKNGRNCGMSRGDIQLGQQDYLCCHRFRASLLRQLLKFSLEGCTKRSGRNPGHSPGSQEV